MKILFLSPVLPWPLKSGGQIRVYHLLKVLKALGQKNEVTLAAYIRKQGEEQFLPELQKICSRVLFIKRNSKPWSIKILLKSLFSTKPLLVNLYRTDYDLANLVNWADLIWAECFYLMDKINKTSKPIILGEQNIEYLAYQRYFQNLRWWKKILLWLPMRWDLIKMKYWEKKIWKKAKKIVVVSEIDKQIIEKETDRNDVTVIPNGVDTEIFKPVKKLNQKKTILFIGEYKWFPNRQAIDWLIGEIFPQIRKKMPETELLIVGRHMLKRWGKMGELGKMENVIINERVEDIREAYKQAGVFLAPLKSGGGTKYKILEAMAMGIPVITTKVGAEGLGGFRKIGVVGETTKDLAEAVVNILKNRERYGEMITRARKYVAENFDWKIIEKKLNKVIKR